MSGDSGGDASDNEQRLLTHKHKMHKMMSPYEQVYGKGKTVAMDGSTSGVEAGQLPPGAASPPVPANAPRAAYPPASSSPSPASSPTGGRWPSKDPGPIQTDGRRTWRGGQEYYLSHPGGSPLGPGHYHTATHMGPHALTPTHPRPSRARPGLLGGRKRPSPAAAPPAMAAGEDAGSACKGAGARTNARHVVLVWDLDETLILFHSLVNGDYQAAMGVHLEEQGTVMNLGMEWEEAVLDLCDKDFYFHQLEAVDASQTCLSEILEKDDGRDLTTYNFEGDYEALRDPGSPLHLLKASYRYRRIRELYLQGLEHAAGSLRADRWKKLYKRADGFCEGWLSSGTHLLRACNEAAALSLRQGVGALTPSTPGGAGNLPSLPEADCAATSSTPRRVENPLSLHQGGNLGTSSDPVGGGNSSANGGTLEVSGSNPAPAAQPKVAQDPGPGQCGTPELNQLPAGSTAVQDMTHDSSPAVPLGGTPTVSPLATAISPVRDILAAAGEPDHGLTSRTSALQDGDVMTTQSASVPAAPLDAPLSHMGAHGRDESPLDAGGGPVPAGHLGAHGGDKSPLEAPPGGGPVPAGHMAPQWRDELPLPPVTVTHVVVTTGQLVPTLAKLLLFDLADLIPPDDVYSARSVGKGACFDRIWMRFGNQASFCVIGDGREEELEARNRKWPYVRVSIIGGSEDPPPSARAADCQGSIYGVPLKDLTARALLTYALEQGARKPP